MQRLVILHAQTADEFSSKLKTMSIWPSLLLLIQLCC